MVFDADEWRREMDKVNEVVSELKIVLSDQRESLIAELHRICEENGLAVESINGSTDNRVFEVHFKDNTSNSIHFSSQFLKSLNMSFSVQRKLDSIARNELYLEIYPLD